MSLLALKTNYQNFPLHTVQIIYHLKAIDIGWFITPLWVGLGGRTL